MGSSLGRGHGWGPGRRVKVWGGVKVRGQGRAVKVRS